jgi:PAS domain-containing protein
MLQYLKNVHDLQITNHTDFFIIAGFPVTLMIISILLIWTTRLKDVVNKQLIAVERDRNDLMDIFDNSDDLIYVCELETHKLLYVNKTFMELFKAYSPKEHPIGDYCHVILQGKTTPCDFCTNDIITASDKPHIWEFYNERAQKWYRCIDKTIIWQGKHARIEIAHDITESHNIIKEKDVTNHQLSAMINALSDAYVLYDVESNTNGVIKWRQEFYNTAYDEFRRKLNRKKTDNPFPKAVMTPLYADMARCYNTAERIHTTASYNNNKYSVYIYKANNGVSLNIRPL